MRLKNLALISSLLLGLSINAYAEHGNHGCHGKKFAQHYEKHLSKLHDKLNLTAAQESAWQSFKADTTPPNKDNMVKHEELDRLNTLERLDRMEVMHKEHQTHHAKRMQAVRAFYDQLTPEQKKVFDDNAMPKHLIHK